MRAATVVLALVSTAGCAADRVVDAAPSSTPTSTPTGTSQDVDPTTSARVSDVPQEAPPSTPSLSAADIPASGPGQWNVATPTGDTPTAVAGQEIGVAVEVEQNLPIDADSAAEFIMATLRDPRGWEPLDQVRFRLIADPAQARIVIHIATPGTTDTMCAPLQTLGYLSCRSGNAVMMNAQRWVDATDEFSSLEVYRQYLINHEVGHALGHGHEVCPAPGVPAPVMQQQTIGLQGCAPNPWPSIA